MNWAGWLLSFKSFVTVAAIHLIDNVDLTNENLTPRFATGGAAHSKQEIEPVPFRLRVRGRHDSGHSLAHLRALGQALCAPGTRGRHGHWIGSRSSE